MSFVHVGNGKVCMRCAAMARMRPLRLSACDDCGGRYCAHGLERVTLTPATPTARPTYAEVCAACRTRGTRPRDGRTWTPSEHGRLGRERPVRKASAARLAGRAAATSRDEPTSAEGADL